MTVDPTPDVSIILPVKDGQRHIAAAIESLINQTNGNFELIIIDDGSTDFTREIAQRYARADKRIRYIRTDISHGVSVARNKGLELARGRYVTFVDSDDIVAPIMLEKLVGTAQQTGAQIVISPFTTTNKNLGETTVNAPLIYTPGEVMQAMFYQKDGFDSAPFAKLFDRNLFNGVKFTPGLRYEDLLILPALYEKVPAVAQINDILYFYRKNKHGFMNGNSPRHLDLLHVTDRLLKEYGQRYPQLIPSLQHRRFSGLMNILRRNSRRRLEVDKKSLDSISVELRTLAPKVLRDKQARLKNRLGALLIYCGIPVTKFVMRWL